MLLITVPLKNVILVWGLVTVIAFALCCDGEEPVKNYLGDIRPLNQALPMLSAKKNPWAKNLLGDVCECIGGDVDWGYLK